MIQCIECITKVNFTTAKDFIRHFKKYHNSDESGRFQCPLCSVTFSRMARYEVHVLKCSLKRNSSAKVQTKPSEYSHTATYFHPSLDNSSESLFLASHGSSQDPIAHASHMYSPNQSLTPSDESQSFTNTMDDSIEKIALEFSLGLHAQPNLTRKDVFKIQDFISENILTKMSDFIESQISECDFPKKSEVSNILNAMKTFFSKVKNE